MKTPIPRRTLLSSGPAAAALLALRSPLRADPALPAGACTLLPEQALGPYYLADELVRSDIREGKDGVPLELVIQVLDVGTCRPVADAAVDLWHCDAAGAYSGFGAAGSQSHSFLRGIQITDPDGVARFQTIFPGCYPGRTNHIHFKVRTAGAREGNTYRGGHTAHTGQVFFPEAITVGLMQQNAYAGQRSARVRQEEDGIFQHQNGRTATARLTPVLAEDPMRGFQAVLAAAIELSAA
jgi:protocatechuate 3,4-dioxygenase beta subunit